MKRIAWSLVVAGLMASQAQANDHAPPVEIAPVEAPVVHVDPAPVVDPVPVDGGTIDGGKVDPTLGDPNVTDVQILTLDGAPADSEHVKTLGGTGDDQLMYMTGAVADGPIVVNHFGGLNHEPGENLRSGEEQPLSMNAATLGLPGLGDNRINLNAFGLFGEHRDSMRPAREGQTVTARKVGLLHLFSKNKAKAAEPTVRTVSTVEKARAQKLAEIDKLRDDALRTGDRAKLAQADKLEAGLNGAPAKTPSKFNVFRK